MTLKTAVIIAGGKGTRLEEHTEDLPKPLVPVAGKPILERILEWLKKNGVENVIIGVAYKKEMVKAYFGDGSEMGLNITYVEHDQNGGTEDAFKTDIFGAEIEDENFYAMNGDQLTDLNLEDLEKRHLDSNAVATLTLVNLKTNFGIVNSNNQNQVFEFQEKGDVPGKNINAGIYVFNKKIKEYLSRGNIEENAFKTLIGEKKLYSFYHDGIWLTVNDKKQLAKVEKFLNNNEGNLLA